MCNRYFCHLMSVCVGGWQSLERLNEETYQKYKDWQNFISYKLTIIYKFLALYKRRKQNCFCVGVISVWGLKYHCVYCSFQSSINIVVFWLTSRFILNEVQWSITFRYTHSIAHVHSVWCKQTEEIGWSSCWRETKLLFLWRYFSPTTNVRFFCSSPFIEL